MNAELTEKVNACPVCRSKNYKSLIDTPAHMHHAAEKFSFSVCDTCDSGFLNPRVKGAHLKRYYTSYYLPYRGAEAWGRYRSIVQQSLDSTNKKRVKTCLKYFQKQQAVAVLDVGCGRPAFLEALQKRTAWNVTGIDFSNEGWKGSSNKEIKLIEGDVQSMAFEKTFNLVTMWHYLEHDYNPPKTIRAVRNILKKGGKLIIEVPDYQSLTAKWQKECWEGWHAPRHTLLYSTRSLFKLLEDQGLHVIDYYRYGTLDAFTLWWMGEMERKGIDWSQPMEQEFLPLVWRKIYSYPLFLFEKMLPFGIQTIVAEVR